MTSAEHIVRRIDHFVLDPGALPEAFNSACAECMELGFAALCVYPWWVSHAVAILKDRVAVSGVVGFPHGLEGTSAKVVAVRQCVSAGARELDVVAAWGCLRNSDVDAAISDAKAVVSAAHEMNDAVIVKLIFDVAELSDEQKQQACRVTVESGAEFLKTATGWAKPATLDDVRLIRSMLPAHVQVKASSNLIETLDDAEAMLDAGATRIGTRHPVEIARAALARARSAIL